MTTTSPTASSAAANDLPEVPGREPEDVGGSRRAIVLGILYLALATLMTVAFGIGSATGEKSTFRLNPRNPSFEIPNLTMPTRVTVFLLAALCAGLGITQLIRGFGKRTNAVLGFVAFVFVFAFLTWASRGNSFSMFGMLQSTIQRATPLAIGAMAGVLCERSGVINIAIEGMMLAAAFTSALVASASGNLWVGLLAGIAIGAAFGSLLAVLSIPYKVDQIVGGTVINIFAVGMTSYLGARILTEYPRLNASGVFRDIKIPGLSAIPFFGPLLFYTSLFAYLTVLIVVGLTIGLGRTRWGLRLRSVGEHPRAADTVGINVRRTRFRAVILGGAVAGLAGTYLTLGSVGRFEDEMTAGRGFIALAAVIFGRYKPTGALVAALLFGFAESLQSKLAILDTPIPSQFLLMAPYLLTLLVVAGVVGKSRVPAADGQPY